MRRSIKVYCVEGKIVTYIQLKNRDKPCYHCKHRKACNLKAISNPIHIYEILRYNSMNMPDVILYTHRPIYTHEIFMHGIDIGE